MDWRVQLVPSQCSTIPTLSSSKSSPAAVHETFEVQETALKKFSPPAPGTSGVACAVQVVPDERSTSGLSPWPTGSYSPTTVQCAGVWQDIPWTIHSAPAGAGIASSRHRVPFQTAANSPTRRGQPSPPAAMHLVAVGHDTAFRLAGAVPGGIGTGRMVQLVPSQCSASGVVVSAGRS